MNKADSSTKPITSINTAGDGIEKATDNMVSQININEFIFGRTKAEKKLEVISSLSDNDIRKTTSATMLRILKECKNGQGKFMVDCKRRVGNEWNSTIEYLYEYQGRPILMLYVQNTSTDSSDTASFSDFNSGSRYCGYCHNLDMRYSYDSAAIARTIRCILAEYLYYKYIEKEEREESGKIAALLHWSIVNPVVNYFYDEWRMKFICGGPLSRRDSDETIIKSKGYYAGKEGITAYVKVHYKELQGKSNEELQGIYKTAFMDAFKEFKRTFNVTEYKSNLLW